MSKYNLKAFAELIGKSERTIRRYIVKGKTPEGKDWKPSKIKRKYVFTDFDLDLWQPDKTALSDTSDSTATAGIDAEALLERLLDAEREIGHLRALSDKNETLEIDLDRLKNEYIEAEALRKTAELRALDLEKELNELKTRSLWQRLFKK